MQPIHSLFGRLSAGASADFFGPYNVFIGVCYLGGIMILALVSNSCIYFRPCVPRFSA